MQNITIEKLRAAAARLGFYKKPINDLIKLIETSVQDKFQVFETKYKVKKEKVSKKLELLKNKHCYKVFQAYSFFRSFSI